MPPAPRTSDNAGANYSWRSDAEVGEQLVLVSHDPFSGDSPYRSASPIFLHLEPCGPPAPTKELPAQLTSRQLSVRAFDSGEMMIDAAVVDGTALGTTIRELFTNEEANKIHVHNASRGCWAVSIDRAPTPSSEPARVDDSL